MKQALVTLAIGPGYRDRFEKFCRKGWTAYAQRHGFDIVVIDTPLDDSARARARSPAWQKCLVLGSPQLAGYERVVWIDSDIYINPAAPSIIEGVAPERIGAMDEHSFPTPEARQAVLRSNIASAPETGSMNKDFWKACLDARDWHAVVGLPKSAMRIVQTGVLVLSPRHHRAMLEHVYGLYEDDGLPSHNYEMRYLSHEIQASGLAHWIDTRFNVLAWWIIQLVCMKTGREPNQAELKCFLMESYLRNHFLHFAGIGDLMPLIGFIGA